MSAEGGHRLCPSGDQFPFTRVPPVIGIWWNSWTAQSPGAVQRHFILAQVWHPRVRQAV